MELPIRYLNEKGQLDDGETSQLRYVYDIMFGEDEPYHNVDWTVVIYPSEVKLIDVPTAAEIFTERYNTGQILCRYKYEEYLKNKDLQDTINGLGLDTDAFWLLVMFCFDYACSMCFDCFIRRPTRGENIENLINLLPDTNNFKAKLSLKTSKGKIEIESSTTISLILEWIKRGYEQDKDLIHVNRIDVNKGVSPYVHRNDESDSVLIWSTRVERQISICKFFTCQIENLYCQIANQCYNVPRRTTPGGRIWNSSVSTTSRSR